jgi:hypothetical protein
MSLKTSWPLFVTIMVRFAAERLRVMNTEAAEDDELQDPRPGEKEAETERGQWCCRDDEEGPGRALLRFSPPSP